MQVCVCADKASDTIRKLWRVLDQQEPVMCSVNEDEVQAGDMSVQQHCDYSYSAARHRLRGLLDSVTQSQTATQPKTVLFTDQVILYLTLYHMLLYTHLTSSHCDYSRLRDI